MGKSQNQNSRPKKMAGVLLTLIQMMGKNINSGFVMENSIVLKDAKMKKFNNSRNSIFGKMMSIYYSKNFSFKNIFKRKNE